MNISRRSFLAGSASAAAAAAIGTPALLSAATVQAPAGWLPCMGQPLKRASYADFFEVIGTTYGRGDGSTTFNVPDLRGRMVVGQEPHPGEQAVILTPYIKASAVAGDEGVIPLGSIVDLAVRYG